MNKPVWQRIFCTDNLSNVSKGNMIKVMETQHNMINVLSMELFCADPNHRVFDKWNEEDKSFLRLERIKRKSKL